MVALKMGRQWELVLNLLSSMPQAKVLPYVCNYDSAMYACTEAGQWEKALNLFSLMPQAKVLPDVFSYDAVMHAFEQGSQWRPAIILLDSVQRSYTAAIG
eukprot:TRINITY_DN18540_c1_g1_i1.p1 TRINITY_DN18540_c1_g1~~TRINITY_DN18540_c1_g1_i1.p1  ORF type:complete len:100 (+),score=9.71 TRINITY_DN18540_c1_g1_i1:1-300(+)